MDKVTLTTLFVEEKKTLSEIGKLYDCDPANVAYWLKKHSITRKPKITFDEPIKQWVHDNCLSRTGSLKNICCNEEWWNTPEKKSVLKTILNRTKDITQNNIHQAIYHIYNDVSEIGKCFVCGKPTHFLRFADGYRQHCTLECSHQSDLRNEKIKKNTDHVLVQQKVKDTVQKKYGVSCVFQLEDVKKKSRQTKRKLYGNENYSNLDKNKRTCLEKYGVQSLFDDDNYQTYLRTRRLEIHGTLVPNQSFVSNAELEVMSFLNSLGFDFSRNRTVLKNLELDCYDAKIGVAVEYCGLYWHSERWKSNDYHFQKLDRCRKANIRLITIFEDEWLERNKQVKSFLSASLGVFETRIPARKCEVKLVDSQTLYNFFEDNHIQGRPNSIRCGYGLWYNGILMGAVSFSNHHRSNHKTVLNRLAFRSGIQIIGGASRLISHSLNALNREIITWSDNRWTEGNIYKKCGLVLDKELSPDYAYVKKQKRIAKQSSTKKKLSIPEDVTEHQWHLDKGIYRIYDCGKKRWLWKNER